MNSELKIKSPNIKLTFTIGFFITVLVIVLALVFRFEFSLILIAIAGSIGLIGLAGFITFGGKVVYRILIWRLDIAERKENLRLTTAKADKAQLEAFVLSFPSSQRQLVSPNAPVKLIEATASYKALPASTQEPIDLLTALDTVQRCLIVGPSDSGKTTLLQHIISRRVLSSKVVVIDPHSYPEKWPSCTVVGKGREYQEIDKALTALVQLMTKRYDEIGRGIVSEMGHTKIIILIDEWRSITFNLGKPASEAIKALLTESRKAAFSVFVATHSERVKPLGIEGEGDLKDGFAVVRLSITDGQRQATIDTGNGEIPALLPGPFQATAQSFESDSFINLEIEPSPTEAAILTLHEQGESISSIAARVFGSKGGNQNQHVKDVLTKFDVA